MTDLDELGEIADANAFGTTGRLSFAGATRPRKPGFSCKAGHPWSVENTLFRRINGRMVRRCRVCQRQRQAERRSNPARQMDAAQSSARGRA